MERKGKKKDRKKKNNTGRKIIYEARNWNVGFRK